MSSRTLSQSLILLLLLSLVGCGSSGSTSSGGDLTALAAPAFSPPAGAYSGTQTVTITTLASGATIRYTLDNSAPTTTHGTLYASPVTISATGTLKALAFLDNRESPVTTAAYVITPLTINHAPTAIGLIGTVYPEVPHAFTLQGSDPDSDPLTFAVVSQPLHGTLTGTPPNLTYTADPGHLGADSFTFTVSDGELTSSAATVTFTAVAETVLAPPTLSPNPAYYSTPQTIALSASPGATIRYTLDGSNPTPTHGNVYTGAFAAASDVKMKAVAFKEGLVSPLAQGIYRIRVPATGEVRVTILSPNPIEADASGYDTRRIRSVGDWAFVAAQIATGVELDSVTATAGERTVPLVFSKDVYCWTTSDLQQQCYDGFGGNLDLSGLPVGAVELTVTAVDHLGNEGSQTILITHDAPPTLTVLAPASGATAHPTMRFAATCTDDEGEGCEIHVSSLNEVNIPNLVPPAYDSLEAVGDLSAYSGKTLYVRFTASDRGGNVALKEYTIVQVEGAQNLNDELTLDGQALDLNETRALALVVTPQGQSLKATNRLSLATADYPLPLGYAVAGDNARKFAYLTRPGAIAVIYRPAYMDYKVMSWENGQEVDLGPIGSVESLKVAGDYAIWNSDSNLYRRNFATAETILVAADAGNWQNDVAENGAVAYWKSTDYSVNLFDGPTLHVADQYQNIYPRTDGQLTAYLKSTGSTYAVALHDGQAETLLTDFSQAYVAPDTYQVAGGVVYYPKPGSLGQDTVWRREADGTQTKLTFFTSDSVLDRAGADGTAMVVNGSDRYLVGLDASLTKVSGSHGITKQIGGQWYLMLGNWVGRYK